MRIEFRVLNTSLKGTECAFDKEEIRVGRAEENEVVLPQRSVSRHHATVRTEDEVPVVEDADSRNDTEVDGQVITSPTPISDGSILSFGDVTVQVLLGDEMDEEEPVPPPMSEPDEMIPSSAEELDNAVEMGENPDPPPGALAGGGGVAAPEESGQMPALDEEFESKLWPTLLVILGLMVGVVLVVFFYRASGQTNVPVEEMGVAVELGQKKVVQVPSGFTRAEYVRPEAALEVGQPLNIDIAVSIKAKSQGLATVRLENESGEFLLLHVNVLARSKDKVKKLFGESLETRSDRLDAARQCMRRAKRYREQTDLYKAMQQYERAVEVLDPLAANPPSELRQADVWRRKLEKRIQRRYDELTFEMSTFMRGGNKKMALERLEEIKRLIPNEEDVRRQNADLMYRLLKRIISRENERSG